MAIFLVILAANLASFANFFFRKNLDSKGSTNGYLLASFSCALLVTFFSQLKNFTAIFSLEMFLCGGIAGCLMFLLMKLTGIALLKGPTHLTLAFQISGSLFPGILLFILFGNEFGFVLNTFIVIGLLITCFGLFLATKNTENTTASYQKDWIYFAIIIFIIHLLLSAFLQWRCLLFTDVNPHTLIPFHCLPEQDIWFILGMFTMALLLQLFVVLKKDKKPCRSEIIYGSLGGLSNAVATSFLLYALTIANPLEQAISFPVFSIAIIFLCNIWSQVLYAEKINWSANLICVLGILITTFS